MDDGLLKARWNLIVVSVVLILFDFAKVSIGQVSVLGTNLIVGNPTVVHSFIWVLWGYLLLRYFQHIAAEIDLGIARAFSEKVRALLFFEIKNRIDAQADGKQYNDYGYDFLQRVSFLKWEIPLNRYDARVGSVTLEGSLAMPSKIVVVALLKAAFHVCVMRPNVTNYVLPFVLAFLAPVVTWCS